MARAMGLERLDKVKPCHSKSLYRENAIVERGMIGRITSSFYTDGLTIGKVYEINEHFVSFLSKYLGV